MRRRSDPDTVVGVPSDIGDEKLQEASVDLLLKREERGIAATGTFVTQIAVVGTFLGAFSLLDDTAKAEVVQSDWSVRALFAAALSLLFSLSTYVLLPGGMPPLTQIDALRVFWNERIRTRKLLLLLALISLAVAIACASLAFVDAREEVAPKPAATVSGKFTPAKDTASTLEATASWSGLDAGERTLTCVRDPQEKVIGAALGSAGGDGKETTTLTVVVKTDAKGDVTITATRLSSAPPADETVSSTCATSARSKGPPTIASITVG
jgi:hypothetical protein